jgi:alpha-tubulin suppressor-like RCC1 family protein
VYAWGLARSGRLGFQDCKALPCDPECDLDHYQATPTIINFPTPVHVTMVSAGESHSLALTNDGRVFAWGVARYGRLGIGDFSQLPSEEDGDPDRFLATPTQISFGEPEVVIEYITAGESHNLAITTSGQLWTWGLARFGRLGVGPLSQCGEVLVGGSDEDDGERYCNRPVPALLDAVIVEASAGVFHSLALSADGDVWAWGLARFGQLGITPNLATLAAADSEEDPYEPTPTRVLLDGHEAKHVSALGEGALWQIRYWSNRPFACRPR